MLSLKRRASRTGLEDLERRELTGKGKWDHNFAKAGISVLSDSIGIPSTQINRMIDAYYSPKQKSNPFAYAFGVPK